jgi:hypothetical protein
MSEIKATIDEIKEIDVELKRMNEHAKKLRVHKKKLEAHVEEYMKEKETPGFRYSNTAVFIQTSTQRKRKSKKDKLNDVKGLLEQAGVYNEDLAKQLINETQGKEVEKNKIKIIRN